MQELNKNDKTKYTTLNQEFEQLSDILKNMLKQSEDMELNHNLSQIKQKLRVAQLQMIEAAVKDVIGTYMPVLTKETTDPDDGLMLIRQEINLIQAVGLMKEIEKKAAFMGRSVVIAIYNSAARPVAVHCMDNAYIASFDVANNKAYTSAALKMSTKVLKNLSQPGQELYGVQQTNQGKIVIFGGGEPLFYNSKLIGALGVSGGTEEEDSELAEFGKNILEEVLMW